MPTDLPGLTTEQLAFLQGVAAAVEVGNRHFRRHFANAENTSLSLADRESALNCSAVIGQLVSELKCLAAGVRREPDRVTEHTAVEKPYWWASEAGKGRS